MTEIKLGVSNRHVHLHAADYQKLFGEEPLTVKRWLVQPAQFASNQTVTLKTAKGQIEHVRVMGPLRPYTQVELSRTDCYKLGLEAPSRQSGDLAGAATVTIIGPSGEITASAAIVAARHLHLNPQERIALGLEQVDEIAVHVGQKRAIVFEHVQLKCDPQATLEFHLDTDEANACDGQTGDDVAIII